jgi:hypothetical protein
MSGISKLLPCFDFVYELRVGGADDSVPPPPPDPTTVGLFLQDVTQDWQIISLYTVNMAPSPSSEASSCSAV